MTRDSTTEQPSTSQAPSTETQEPPSETSESAPTRTDRTTEPTTASVQTSAEVSESPTAAPTTAAESSDSGDSVAWLWWVLIGLALVALVVWLWRRRQSRLREQRSFDLALAEARWLEHDALPTLLSADRDARRGAWQVARPRVAALEEQLAQLAPPGSSSLAAVNAQHLRTAVVGVRSALDDESQATSPEAAGEAHGAARQAARQLEQVLSELAPSTPAG